MRKISTLYKKNKEDMGRVTQELNENNSWVFESGIPTRKYDGTSCAIIGGVLYKRYDAKRGKKPPKDSIPCQDADMLSGHHPHWVLCNRLNAADKYHFEAFDKLKVIKDGTYELCGPKVNGNKEKFTEHVLIPHGTEILDIRDFTYVGLENFLKDPKNDIEGIVFHDSKGTGKMCKIRKTDFGIKR